MNASLLLMASLHWAAFLLLVALDNLFCLFPLMTY
jgi:hypothetical protein